MVTINDLTVHVSSLDERSPSANEAVRRVSAAAYPQRIGPGGSLYQFQATLTGAAFRYDALRLQAIWDESGIVEVGGEGFADPGGDPGLAVPLGSALKLPEGGNHALFSAAFLWMGAFGTYRGRLTGQALTLANDFSQAGLTRLLLPTGSLNPGDAATALVVDTPSANKFTTNWGTQDTTYLANEVARGRVLFDVRSGFYANFVDCRLDSTTGQRAPFAGLSAGTRKLVVTHRLGRVELDPSTGKIFWFNTTGGSRSATLAGFARWAVHRWTPQLVEVNLDNAVTIEVHAHGLVRLRDIASKLTFVEATPNQTTGGAFVRQLNLDSWWVTATKDWSVTALVLAVGAGGHAYVFYDAGGTQTATARPNFKDTRAVLRLEGF